VLRFVAATIAGYATISFAVFLSSTAAYQMLGTERTLVAGTYDVSALWLGVSFLLFSVATFVGGYVCAVLAPSGRASAALAALVLVLGLLVAAKVIREQAEPTVRASEVSDLDAMRGARQPPWVALANPLLGAACVLAGARLRRSAAA
jgi:hypothetical protein